MTDQDHIVPDPRRLTTGVLVALVVTLIAIVVLVIDNWPRSSPDARPEPVHVIPPVEVPADRAQVGPAKGVSVVTSSTTSSTMPITTTSTSLPG